MGANHAGEIAALAAIAQPQVGVVTQAGDAHLEGFGSRDGVAHAKGELFAGLPENGVAVINADDHYRSLWRELAGERSVLEFGLQAGTAISAEAISALPQEAPEAMQFDLLTPAGRATVNLPLPDTHEFVQVWTNSSSCRWSLLHVFDDDYQAVRVEIAAVVMTLMACRLLGEVLSIRYPG